MTVSTIATIAAGLTRTQGDAVAKPADTLNAVLQQATQSSPQTFPTDTSPASAAISLQNQVAQFRVASQDVAQGSGAISTAQFGADEISRHLGRLQDIALLASSSNISPQQRAQLNSEFQALRARIDALATTTSFNGQPVLDGSGTAQGISTDLTDAALFKNAQLDVTTQANAQAASAAVKAASDYTSNQAQSLQTLQAGLDEVASGLQSAIQNREAANSTLEDTDITAELFGEVTAGAGANNVANNASVSLAAQTNRLPTNLLQLLSE